MGTTLERIANGNGYVGYQGAGVGVGVSGLGLQGGGGGGDA